MTKKKVAVAMSGGVDSGVAAALLVKAGYECAGFHLHLWHESNKDLENKCCSTESLEAARKTAYQLKIPFYTLDFAQIFKKKVVDDFLAGYAAGLTPNPCIRCNQLIKFGRLWQYVNSLDYDFLATGHYARVHEQRLFQAKDKSKDQSYFLYNLTQKQLTRILFPIGDYTKKQVRAMAKEQQLSVAQRPESQEICFFPETDYRPFLRRQISKKIIPGKVVDTRGRQIGRHAGLPLYTIGQRHGFTITNSQALGPFYVIHKDIENNRLIVGFGRETEEKEFLVKDVHWLQASSDHWRGKVKIRHQGELLNCELDLSGSADTFRVTLSEPERGIAPGQSAVFYRGSEVLGGGTIVLDKK